MPPYQVKSPLAVIALVAITASIIGLRNDFVYDDILILLHDPRISDVSSWSQFLFTPYWPPPHSPDLYRPLASLLLAIQYTIGGGEPGIFRFVSIGLYVAGSIAIYKVAVRLVSERAALVVALLFAAHPVHVEAVALGVNQGELIVGILTAWALCVYIDARRAGALSTRHWALLAAIYAMAALTKENGFVLPGLLAAAELFLIEGAPLAARAREIWRGYAALAAVAVTVLTLRAMVLSGDVVGAFTAEAFVGVGLGGRMLTMLGVVPTWFRLFTWPEHLQMDYSPDEIVAATHFGAPETLGAAMLVAAAATLWFARKRAPVVSFGLAWCAISLFPVSNIVPTSIVLAERTLFLPSAGFIIAVVGAAAFVVRLIPARTAQLQTAGMAACAGLILLGVGRSSERQSVWKNSARFWRVAAHDAPHSKRVHEARRQATLDLIRDYTPVIENSPERWRARYNLALMLRVIEADSAAAEQLMLAIADKGDHREAKIELASAYLSMGKYAEARRIVSDERSSGDTAWPVNRLLEVADSAELARAPAGSVMLYFGFVVDR